MEGGGESRINIPKEQLFADQKGRLTARHARRQSVISVKCFFHDDLAHTFDAAHVLLSGERDSGVGKKKKKKKEMAKTTKNVISIPLDHYRHAFPLFSSHLRISITRERERMKYDEVKSRERGGNLRFRITGSNNRGI